MPLFDIEDLVEKTTNQSNENNKSKIKLKKGQTISDLIIQARKLVTEKLGKYRYTSKCVTNIEDFKKFINQTQDTLALDVETTRFRCI